jgi:glycogen operon protein
MKNDPILGNLKLIAEPWDVGPFGWQTGQFGIGFSEWNDRFRNTMRQFWLDDNNKYSHANAPSSLSDLGTRIAGSADLFHNSLLRTPSASINNITTHDGFTLFDLCSYNSRHNEANLENNNDGTRNNLSYNHGHEGKTDDKTIMQERAKSMKNLFALLFCSNGTPMILGGDEIGRTQRGNNNAYCQDNSISWYDWNVNEWQVDIFLAVKQLIEIRKNLPALRKNKFYEPDTDASPTKLGDINWYDANGNLFKADMWSNPNFRLLQVFFERPTTEDKDVLVVINGQKNDMEIILPKNVNQCWDEIFYSSLTVEHLRGGIRYEHGVSGKTTIDAFSVRIFASC